MTALREMLAAVGPLTAPDIRAATRIDLAALPATRRRPVHDAPSIDSVSRTWREAPNGEPILIGNVTPVSLAERDLSNELDALRARPPWARQFELFTTRAAVGDGLEAVYLSHGHHPRLAAVPFRFAVYGRDMAFVSYDFDDVTQGAYIITSASMIEDLRLLFIRLWADSQPLVVGEPGTDALDVVRSLSRGLTDDAAASRIGVSVRTYRRRIQQLMWVFKVNSRFAAGVEAGRRGLVDLASASDGVELVGRRQPAPAELVTA